MQISGKRFRDELYYYSNQFILFFVMIISLTSGSWLNAIVTSLLVLCFMLVQTTLLAAQGHIPILRFLYSFITPLGYSILRATLGDTEFTESATLLLIGASVYIAVFQTLSLVMKRPFFRKLTESALSIGSALIFILFYAYLDLRISVTAAYARGDIDAEAMTRALQISEFPAVLNKFIRAPQHLFALFGVISFDFMLFIARLRAFSLQQRLNRLLEMPQVAERIVHPGLPHEAATAQAAQAPLSSASPSAALSIPPEDAPAGAETISSASGSEDLPAPALAAGLSALVGTDSDRGRNHVSMLVTVVSSDIIGFTDLSERIGKSAAVTLLNRYYALWTQCAGSFGGRIASVSADTVVSIFGFVDPERSADRGLNAAYAFLQELEGMREDMVVQSMPDDLKVSIGIHSGWVTAAQLGPPGQQKLSFFGDAIAVAARLDSLCREFHQPLLVSHASYRRMMLESQVTLERFSEVLLRKSTRPMPLYTKKP